MGRRTDLVVPEAFGKAPEVDRVVDQTAQWVLEGSGSNCRARDTAIMLDC